MKDIRGLLGLCCRAGQATLGADLALREIKAGRAGLALIDQGAAEGTKKKILDACAYRSVPAYILPEGEIDLSCGKEGRMAAAIQSGEICRAILKRLT